jgi:hypothetical protein
MHPVEICEANHARGKRPIPEGWYPNGCSCLACDQPYWPTWQEFVDSKVGEITAESARPPVDEENWRVRTRMTLCPVCGFKRCPGAANHENRCTGSNAVGQPDSLYAPEPVSEEERQRRRKVLDEMNEITGDNRPLETEEEKREGYLAKKDDPEEWG